MRACRNRSRRDARRTTEPALLTASPAGFSKDEIAARPSADKTLARRDPTAAAASPFATAFRRIAAAVEAAFRTWSRRDSPFRSCRSCESGIGSARSITSRLSCPPGGRSPPDRSVLTSLYPGLRMGNPGLGKTVPITTERRWPSLRYLGIRVQGHRRAVGASSTSGGVEPHYGRPRAWPQLLVLSRPADARFDVRPKLRPSTHIGHAHAAANRCLIVDGSNDHESLAPALLAAEEGKFDIGRHDGLPSVPIVCRKIRNRYRHTLSGEGIEDREGHASLLSADPNIARSASIVCDRLHSPGNIRPVAQLAPCTRGCSYGPLRRPFPKEAFHFRPGGVGEDGPEPAIVSAIESVGPPKGDPAVKLRILLAAAGVAVLAAPAANSQAIVRGAKEGAAVGNRATGPIGAAVGGVVGGASFGFRSGASRVLGIPEETGSVQRVRTPQKRRHVNR
jgi:hypothetical protein